MAGMSGDRRAVEAVDAQRIDAAVPMTDTIRASLRACHRITKQHARNFYHGLKLTPEPKRSALYAVYAFMRACDDLADGPCTGKGAPREALERIEAFRATMQRVLDAPAVVPPDAPLPEGAIWPAFHYVVHSYPINPAHLHAMLDGQRCDLLKHRYADFEELYDYCYKVASVVGLVCLAVWGDDGDPQARKLAEYRGIAFQLTNILRDVAEDARRGRVYLPADEMERFGYTADDLLRGRGNTHFDRLMTYQIERAHSYYEMSARLEQHLSPPCRATSYAMTWIYRGLLDRIAQDPRQVLSRRVRLGRLEKLRIATRAAWRRSRGR